MKDDVSKNHPVKKSLSVFPFIPDKQPGIISSSNSFLKADQTKQRKRKIPTKVKFSHRTSVNHIESLDRLDVSQENRNDLLYIRNTKAKLERAVDFLPIATTKYGCQSLCLPPIKSYLMTPQNSKFMSNSNCMQREEWLPDYKAFILPVVSTKKVNCSCRNPPSTKDLDKVLKKCIAKEFRPEETPPLFSVYVRWKNRRNGTIEYNRDTLHEIFEFFGEVSKIILKSKASAIIVFCHVESACNADKVMQNIGKDLKMHVRWLNDMSK